ncbi:hypothetical protein RCL1_001406 [Eukaryota sp. TZLM3-RCL]
MTFKCFENIQNFVKAALALGVDKALAFEPVDLYELRNRRRVFFCVYELSRLSRFLSEVTFGHAQTTANSNIESPLLACENESEVIEKEVPMEQNEHIIVDKKLEFEQIESDVTENELIIDQNHSEINEKELEMDQNDKEISKSEDDLSDINLRIRYQ